MSRCELLDLTSTLHELTSQAQ